MSRRPLNRPSVRTKQRRDSMQVQEKHNLLVDMLPLVKRLAFQIREHLPSHVEVDDLIANGVLGLVDAIRKFDATKRVKFKTYAQQRLRGAILDGLRGADPASRELTAGSTSRQPSVEPALLADDPAIAGPSPVDLREVNTACIHFLPNGHFDTYRATELEDVACSPASPWESFDIREFIWPDPNCWG